MTTRSHATALAAVLALSLHCGSASAALTGQYLLEEGSGTMANDTSGFSRTGTLTGGPVATPTGQPDYAAGLYVGSNSSLRLNYNTTTMAYDNSLIHRVVLPADQPYVRNATAMTLMAWIRPDVIATSTGLVGSSRSIVGVSESTGLAVVGTRGIIQILPASGQFRVLGRRVDGGGNANYVSNGATPLAAVVGQTYFVVGILDYENANIRLYVNGVQHTGGTTGGAANLGTAGPTNLSMDLNNATAIIGTNMTGLGEQFNGLIDGVRIFDHALTAEEILNTYNAEKLAVNDANFDNDAAVNGNDFVIWQRGLGTGTTNAQGDANGDGAVNSADLAIWKGASARRRCLPRAPSPSPLRRPSRPY